MKILVADDSRVGLAMLVTSLREMGHEVLAADSGEKAIALFTENQPDLVILDVVMKGMDGFECARQIRRVSQEDWTPIIFLSASVDDKHVAQGIDAGGDDYLTKPFSQITLGAKIKAMERISDMRKELYEKTKQLQVLSTTDSLTGLYNRFQFDKCIEEKFAEANRHQLTIALMMIDLDKFKQVNDIYGHHVGDLLLVQVAKRLRESLRINDFVARLGGDEFAVVLTHVEAREPLELIAKKIVKLLSTEFHINQHVLHIGASVGIALYPADATTTNELIKNADAAMYEVKKSGKNAYTFFQEKLLHEV